MLTFQKIWLCSKRYGYNPSYTASQLRLIQDTIRFQLRYYQKVCFQTRVKLGLRSIRSYVYIPKYPATLTYKDMLTFQKYGYVPKEMVMFQATQLLSYAYTIQDMFRFQLRYNQKVRFQSRVKLGLRFKICSFAYVSKYILRVTLLNPFIYLSLSHHILG